MSKSLLASMLHCDFLFPMMFPQDVANIRVTSSHDKRLRDNRLGLYIARGQFAKTASIAKPML